MYNTGTVTTTANSTKLVGTGTKWLNNINRVSAEQAIQVQIGNTVYNNSIQSIQSDTELTLNFPLPVAATGAKYVILTTIVHSVSDSMNKIVSMNVSNVQFSDILTRWMTEQGIITVTLPDQTTQQLRTTKEMDKQLEGKVDKTTGEMESITVYKKGLNYPFLRLKKDDGSTLYLESKPDEQPVMSQLYERGSDGKIKYSISFPKSMGTAMLVGDYGWGAGAKQSSNWNEITENGVYVAASSSQPELPEAINLLMVLHVQSGYTASQIAFRSNSSIISTWRRSKDTNGWGKWYEFYTQANTTKDANGNLKAASPIVKVFADHIENNDESEGVTLKKLHTGIYQLHGVLGLHSDASWGGINGGITIPCGINQLPLVYALYDVLEKGKQHPFDGRIVEPDEDGDIVLYTTYRKHDLPQNIQYERFKLYPEFLKEVDGEKVELTPGEPCDIPVGHWVDVRVNMPSNSIYNQKQAEAERLAKIEAERLAQEEAKRAAEEAERAEQEAAEQVEQQ
ncbi:pyocin knob domain-containing protein [Providencia huaxiensis]|uniref:pyocin knob domain-containing protein n=1 Tax=Providencia huaxiensis TaxID=2027290 RepID=UPI0024ABB2F2|nr:hypothetical protein [Providencia rettgeri]